MPNLPDFPPARNSPVREFHRVALPLTRAPAPRRANRKLTRGTRDVKKSKTLGRRFLGYPYFSYQKASAKLEEACAEYRNEVEAQDLNQESASSNRSQEPGDRRKPDSHRRQRTQQGGEQRDHQKQYGVTLVVTSVALCRPHLQQFLVRPLWRGIRPLGAQNISTTRWCTSAANRSIRSV